MARIDHYRAPDAQAANSIVVAVTAFIQNGAGQLLLIRRTGNDLYAIPGGALELGETSPRPSIAKSWRKPGSRSRSPG